MQYSEDPFPINTEFFHMGQPRPLSIDPERYEASQMTILQEIKQYRKCVNILPTGSEPATSQS